MNISKKQHQIRKERIWQSSSNVMFEILRPLTTEIETKKRVNSMIVFLLLIFTLPRCHCWESHNAQQTMCRLSCIIYSKVNLFNDTKMMLPLMVMTETFPPPCYSTLHTHDLNRSCNPFHAYEITTHGNINLKFFRNYMLQQHGWIYISSRLRPRQKWPPFCRRCFQMHFLEWKCVNFASDFTEVCSSGSN